ncbi:hypothetical protein [Sutterella sp.]|uniref:hypothetical protein n=1 Tax=Sutterella sp. TaxID=1981025 RepID=UPI003FD73486
MQKQFILLPLAAAAVLTLSGCVSVNSTPENPQAAAKLTPEFQYHKDLSRANNIAIEFGIKRIIDTPAPKDKLVLSDGSVALDAGLLWSIRHKMSANGFMSSTANWNLAVGVSVAQWLFTPSVEATADSLVGYVRAEEAKDATEAANLFVKRSAEALAEAFRKQEQFKDYQITINYDESWTGRNDAHIEVVNEELGCKPWKDVLMNMYGCGVQISNTGLKAFRPQISTPRFTNPQIEVFYVQAGEATLHFWNGGAKPKFDWARAMMETAPSLPEYIYAYLYTHEGPAPAKYKNPPFIVEKDKVNFFVIPQLYEMDDPLSEEEKKAVQARLKTDSNH